MNMTDPVERERRKARWTVKFAGWLADITPFVWTLGKQLVLWTSIAFFVGTGTLTLFFGVNLLVAFLIAEAVAIIGLLIYRKVKHGRGAY
jgi:hypothetical protein